MRHPYQIDELLLGSDFDHLAGFELGKPDRHFTDNPLVFLLPQQRLP